MFMLCNIIQLSINTHAIANECPNETQKQEKKKIARKTMNVEKNLLVDEHHSQKLNILKQKKRRKNLPFWKMPIQYCHNDIISLSKLNNKINNN